MYEEIVIRGSRLNGVRLPAAVVMGFRRSPDRIAAARDWQHHVGKYDSTRVRTEFGIQAFAGERERVK